MKRIEPQFVICVKNEEYAASLELRNFIKWFPTTAALSIATSYH